MEPKENKNHNKIDIINERFNSINSWLKKYEVISNVIVIIGVAIIGMLFTLLPFHPAQLSLNVAQSSLSEARSANNIAVKGLRASEKSSEIAKKASKTAEAALSLSKTEISAQYTPHIKAYVTSQNIYVGAGTQFGRKDDLIIIPIMIVNKGNGLAKDIEFVMYYDYGSGTVSSPVARIIPYLKGASSVDLIPPFAPSILSDAVTQYRSRRKTFRMKIFLTWRDTIGKEIYKSVGLFRLYTTEAYADQPSRFVLIPEGVYNHIEHPDEFNKYSKKEIDF